MAEHDLQMRSAEAPQGEQAQERPAGGLSAALLQRKLQREFDAARAIDFFPGEAQAQVRRALADCAVLLADGETWRRLDELAPGDRVRLTWVNAPKGSEGGFFVTGFEVLRKADRKDGRGENP